MNISQSNITSPVGDDHLHGSGIAIYIPVVYSIVFIVGLIGNSLLLYLLVKYTKLKSVSNIFIFNLAIADILFMVGLPFLAYALASPSWNLGTAVCKIVLSIDGLNQFTGIYLLTVMSVDRYIVFVHPMKTMAFRTATKAKLVALCVWIFSSIVIFPLLLYSKLAESSKSTYACTVVFPQYFNRTAFLIYTFILAFVLPLLIIITCYLLISLELRRSRGPAIKTNAKKSSQKVIKMVILYVTIFIVCWLPFYVIQFTYMFHVDQSKPPSQSFFVLYLTSICLSYANSAINPYIYTLSTGAFRRNIQQSRRKQYKIVYSKNASVSKSNEKNGTAKNNNVKKSIILKTSDEIAV
ncbi:somatostatin receptor type 1-like [Saccoglossus kowalevskii]|uniref:Somatostatin receptor type 1-like n=1 Tax=Saccoglossus kowalevskii TaxID=10224 RepID=A0ABM0GY98_SACKO|nr:PREDICTED: somatostatin receptor type 1-like [Saccoglossus kowalevskii]